MVDCQWELKFTHQTQKDAKKLAASGLKPKAEQLLKILQQNPFTNLDSENVVKIIRMWSHYGD